MLTYSQAELQDHYASELAQSESPNSSDRPLMLELVEYGEERLAAVLEIEKSHLRSGGIVTGATLFQMVDAMGYLVTLSRSPRGTVALTVDLSMQFLRAAPMGELRIEGRCLRYGNRLCVVETRITSREVTDGPVATAVVSFAPVTP